MPAKTARRNGIDQDAEYVGGLVKRVGNFRAGAYGKEIEERKQFQKTVYLMQAFGIKLGYDFSWYIEGPYSSALADVGYEIADHYHKIPALYFSDEDVEKTFRQYLAFMDDFKADLDALEIAASLHFLWGRNKDMQRDQIIRWLHSEKDLERNPSGINHIWNQLEAEGVIQT